MGKIYFVRHGESEYNAGLTTLLNSELTVKGLKQADWAALFLNTEIENKDDFIGYVSPLQRCLQTASTIHTLTGLKFKVCTDIGEAPQEQNIHIYSTCSWFGSFDWSDFPYMATYTSDEEEYKKRIKSFVDTLKDDKNYVIVSHMSPIMDMIRMICFDNKKAEFTIPNCSVSLVEDRKPVYLGKT